MFPRPSRKYILAGGAVIGLLTLAVVANSAYLAYKRIGWSVVSTSNTPLPSNAVNDLLPLPDGRMALATDQGVTFWTAAEENDVLDRWQTFNPGNSPLPNERVLALALDQEEQLWVGTASGLAAYDGQGWQVYRGRDFGLLSEQVNALALGSDGRLWVGTQVGAAVFDGQAWTAYMAGADGLVDNAVFACVIQAARAATGSGWHVVGVSSIWGPIPGPAIPRKTSTWAGAG
jgi:ligand-binding sensor domain-containing protein